MARLPIPSAGAIFGCGALLQLWLWSRAWLYWDQILLLRLGMSLVNEGELAVFAKVMSGGGVIPGCFLQLLVAAPLALWFDYRSPGLLVLAFHLLAGLILWRVVAAGGGRRMASVYLLVYWLSPWRLYHGGFLWEPSYMLLPAALHLWASWRLRTGPENPPLARPFAPSLVLGAVVVLAPQIHGSGVTLLLLSVLLLWRRRIAPRFAGLAAGGLLGAVPLVSLAIGALRAPLPAVAGGSLADLGFVRLAPLVRPIQYWLRIASPDLGRRLRQTVFWPSDDRPLDLAGGLLHALQAASVVSVVLVVVANLWLWRRLRGGGASANERFFGRYALSSLVALLLAAGLSPATLQGWHAIVVLHAACLPVALWIGAVDDRADDRRTRLWRAAILAFLILRLPQILALGLGHPMYRSPTDAASRARVAPENLPSIELERIPFGSGKESEGPEWQSIPLR